MNINFNEQELNNAENKGRNKVEKLLKQIGITKYLFSENPTEVYDCIFITNEGKRVVAEIKNRDNKYANYSDMLLEKHKYDNLVKISKEMNADPIYIHTYNNSNQIKITNLKDKEFIFKEQYQQKTQLGNRNSIKKLLTYITEFNIFNI